MRRWGWLTVACALLALPAVAEGQFPERDGSNRLLQRWVGAKANGLPIWLDFFGDSMLVVSDNIQSRDADYSLAPGRVTVYGDSITMRILATSFNGNREGEDFGFLRQFELSYRFSLDRMIMSADGRSITMTAQNRLARPLEANWIADLPDGRRMELRLQGSGSALYRFVPGGGWRVGEWDRNFGDITLDWNPPDIEEPDSSLIWTGLYDADGQQILLEQVIEGSSVTIFRRIIR